MLLELSVYALQIDTLGHLQENAWHKVLDLRAVSQNTRSHNPANPLQSMIHNLQRLV